MTLRRCLVFGWRRLGIWDFLRGRDDEKIGYSVGERSDLDHAAEVEDYTVVDCLRVARFVA